MLIEISIETFSEEQAGEGHVADILRLLMHFSDGRHTWAVASTDLDTIEAYLNDQAPRRLAPNFKNLARESAVQSVAYASREALPPIQISPENLRDHTADLSRPAVIAVENSHSDGLFIKVIAKVFDEIEVLDAIEQGWLVIRHGGGHGETCRIACEEHASFRRLQRVAMLLDSDRMAPGMPELHQNLNNKVRAAGVLTHVLELREAENYIPNEVLASVLPIRDSHPRLGHLKALTAPQRGHFDIKHGFQKTKGIPDSQKSLFADQPSNVIRGLEHGWGTQVLLRLKDHVAGLTERSFVVQGADLRPELRNVLAMLRKIV